MTPRCRSIIWVWGLNSGSHFISCKHLHLLSDLISLIYVKQSLSPGWLLSPPVSQVLRLYDKCGITRPTGKFVNG